MCNIGNSLHNKYENFFSILCNLLPFSLTASADIFRQDLHDSLDFYFFLCQFPEETDKTQSPAANNQKIWISVHIRISVIDYLHNTLE